MSTEAPRPTIQVHRRWDAVFEPGPAREALEAAIGSYIQARRWYRTKTRAVREAHVTRAFVLPRIDGADGDAGRIALVAVALDGGQTDTYVLPLCFVPPDGVDPKAVVASLSVRQGEGERGVRSGCLVDGVFDRGMLRAFLGALKANAVLRDGDGTLTFHGLAALAGDAASDGGGRVLDREQTNTSILFDHRFVGKLLRKLDEGESADLEMGRFLTEAGYDATPALVGWVDVDVDVSAGPSTVALLHRFVPNEGDAWGHALAALGARLDRTGHEGEGSGPAADAYDGLAFKLGQRVGEMHRLLARGEGAFAPAPLDAPTRKRLAEAVRGGLRRSFARLHEGSLADESRDLLARLDGSQPRLAELLTAFEGLEGAGLVTRIHGDLHLGQTLFTGHDFVLIDFEGEPARPLDERKAKRSPFADVAGMLRSFHYASASALRARASDGTPTGPGSAPRQVAEDWKREAEAAFLRGWREGVASTDVMPGDAGQETLLRFFLLEKAAYEVGYEMDNRPDWLAIPLEGLRDILRV